MRQIQVIGTLLVLMVGSISAISQDRPEDQHAWEKKVGKSALNNPAYAYVEDDLALPRILLVGDSISIGYTSGVRDLLEGKANVHRIPMNGGNTNRGLEQLEDWLGVKEWDVIHFNWGLHDIKRLNSKNKMDITARKALAPTHYKRNIKRLVRRLKSTKARIIWASTTPVPKGAAGRILGDEVEYNFIADKIMKRRNIEVNDLHAHIFPSLVTMQRDSNVHFHADGSTFLAEKVVVAILGNSAL